MFYFRFVVVLVCLWGGGVCAEEVVTRIVSDRGVSGDGTSFRVGVHFTLPPRAHIYWRNPGDSGLPTRVGWSLPAGYAVGDLQWPAPVAFSMPALGETSFGYEEEALLFSEVVVPTGEGDAEILVRADVRWLLCLYDGVCIPGRAKLARRVGTVSEEEVTVLNRFMGSVPKRLAGDSTPVRISSSEEGGGQLTVALAAPWSFLEEDGDVGAKFFPERGSVWEMAQEGGEKERVVFRAPKAVEESIGGVVVVSGRNSATGESGVFNVAMPVEKN